MRIKCRGILIVLLAASLMTLAGCQQLGVEVPFETIEQQPDYGAEMGYSILEPRVVLVARPEEIDRVRGYISPAALEQLNALDFTQYVVIAVFRERQASGGFATIIERITLQDDQATIYAQFWEMRGYVVIDAMTSPYHLVKVRRDAGINQETTLILKARMFYPSFWRRLFTHWRVQ